MPYFLLRILYHRTGGIATILLGIGILFRFFSGQIQALKRRVAVVFVHPCPGVAAQEGRQIGGGFLLLLGYVRDGEFQVKSPFKNLFYVLAFFIASIMRRSCASVSLPIISTASLTSSTLVLSSICSLHKLRLSHILAVNGAHCRKSRRENFHILHPLQEPIAPPGCKNYAIDYLGKQANIHPVTSALEVVIHCSHSMYRSPFPQIRLCHHNRLFLSRPHGQAEAGILIPILAILWDAGHAGKINGHKTMMLYSCPLHAVAGNGKDYLIAMFHSLLDRLWAYKLSVNLRTIAQNIGNLLNKTLL